MKAICEIVDAFKIYKTVFLFLIKILIGTQFYYIIHSYLHVCAHLINFTSTY